MTTLVTLREQLDLLADPEQAIFLQRFFKTGPGEYAHGDKFIGIRVPPLRRLARDYRNLSLQDLQHLIDSPIHEERLLALIILTSQFDKADEQQQGVIYRFYVKKKKQINNWDLVDISAPHIIGKYLMERDHKILLTWVKSRHLWTRRIAVLATFHFIRQHQYQDTLQLVSHLLSDKHDLIHKACGWMLREIGKRDLRVLESFLIRHYQDMPRTMLRYAIERLPERQRQAYLKGLI